MGQSGGADFLDCKAGEGKMVKILTIYADSERVKSIKLTYSDNTTSSTHDSNPGLFTKSVLSRGRELLG